jgi:hypothetical protein
VSLSYTNTEDKKAVSKLNFNKEVDNSASNTLKKVNVVVKTDLEAGILA